MRLALFLLAVSARAQTVISLQPALDEIAATHRFLEAAIAPDGSHVAYVEAWGAPSQSAIYIAPRTRISAADGLPVHHKDVLLRTIRWFNDNLR